jgi:hypothetical protein
LKGWGYNLRGKNKKRKSDISRELAELENLEEQSPLLPADIVKRAELQQELLDILDKEEKLWRQRARDNWLLQSDCNTAYFHRLANGCKRKSTIFSLKNGETLIQGDEELLQHATDFYRDLFGPEEDRGVRLDESVWHTDEKLNDSDRERLCRRFTMEEVKDVIDQMEKNKAAGPDGIPIEFYQACWEIIKSDIMVVFDDLFEHKIELARINYGIITLIPKGEDADTIQKFRPICQL